MGSIATPPVGAPATPAPAAVPSTPAVSTPTPAAPATPTPAPALEPTGDSGLDRIRAGWQKAKETVAEGEEPAGDEPAAEPAAEPPAVEEPATEEPAAAPAEEPEAPAATEAVEEVAELDDGSTLDPRQFFKDIKGTEAEKWLNDHPEVKGQIGQALRVVNEARDIMALVPDVETARTVTSAAASWQGIDNKFLSGTTKEGAKGFLDTWAREALMVDANGKPTLDAQGQYQFHPALMNILDTVYSNKLDLLAERAEKTGDERLKTALEIIREVSSPPSPGLDEVPEEMKPYADKLKADRAALDAEKAEGARKQSESARVANEQSIERSETTASQSLQRQLEPLFAKSGLSKFEQNAALAQIGEAIDAELGTLNEDGSWQPGGDKFFQSTYDHIVSQPPSEAREKALTAHYLKYANPRLGRIAAKVTREAKAGTLDRQTVRTTQVAAQQRTSQTEPRGASITTPSAGQPQTPKAIRAQIIEQYKAAHGGSEPEATYVLAEVLKRERSKTGARA
jgi:hypothetical protein